LFDSNGEVWEGKASAGAPARDEARDQPADPSGTDPRAV